MSSRFMTRCSLLIVLATGLLNTTATLVLALEMHPPWIHDQPKMKSPHAPPWVARTKIKDKSPWNPPWVAKNHVKEKSPHAPPWIGNEDHVQELARDGVWSYPVDWRDVDWSQADSGRELHMRTQAFSKKIWGDTPKRPNDGILEYYRDPPTTGPRRLVK